MRIIAHRGFSAQRPENTITSFDHALSSGVNSIELDVHLTTDHVLVVIHDDTVDRTTDGSGRVKDFTFDELKSLDAGSWFNDSVDYSDQTIPSFEEILLRYHNKVNIYIEIKSDEVTVAPRLKDLFRKTGWADEKQVGLKEGPGLSILSFNLEQLTIAKEISPELEYGYLRLEVNEKDMATCTDRGFSGFFPYIGSLNSDMVTKAHERGLYVGAWGAQTDLDVEKAFHMGVQGLTVDNPVRALSLVKSLKSQL
jgi:glycerophosphoryl diester phosphodiesterase